MDEYKKRELLRWLASAGQIVPPCSLFQAELMEHKRADDTVRLLLDEGFPASTNEDNRVEQLHARLEALIDHCPREALALMEALAPIASDLYLHHIYNSIGIYLYDVGPKVNYVPRPEESDD